MDVLYLSTEEKAPVFHGQGTSFLDSGRQVRLRERATATDPASKAPLLVLHMNSAPRQVWLSAGGGRLGDRGGVARILEFLRINVALGAADATYREVMLFTQNRRAGQSIDEFVVEFDPLRCKAESRMEMRTGFPEQFPSILRMHNAALRRPSVTRP